MVVLSVISLLCYHTYRFVRYSYLPVFSVVYKSRHRPIRRVLQSLAFVAFQTPIRFSSIRPVPWFFFVCSKVRWFVHVNPKSVKTYVAVMGPDELLPHPFCGVLEEIRENYLSFWPYLNQNKKKNLTVKCFSEFLKDIKRVNIQSSVLRTYPRTAPLSLLSWGML